MSYQPRFTITKQIHALLEESEQLRAQLTGQPLIPAAQATVRYRSTVESVHSSTSIEGNSLTLGEVRTLLRTQPTLSARDYAAIEVQNYGRALEFIAARRDGAPTISLSDVLQLHQLIAHRLLDPSRAGHFRRRPVYIEGRERQLLYTAAPPELVAGAVESLLSWGREQRFTLNPIIIAGIFHYQLLAIHPFADGNGRTARALTSLALALSHYDHNGSLTLDPYYAADRPAYYQILQQTHGSDFLRSRDQDLTEWLVYFVTSYLSSLRVLQAEIRLLQLATPDHTRFQLTREDTDILSFVAQFGSISISEAEGILPELSRRQLQRRLKKLVNQGFLELTGQARQQRYLAAANPL